MNSEMSSWLAFVMFYQEHHYAHEPITAEQRLAFVELETAMLLDCFAIAGWGFKLAGWCHL
jgi:hypothetical protein